MSFDSGPEYTAPDEQRCDALVRGHPSWTFIWMRSDHRCPKTANQSRAGKSVCHAHARAKQVEWFSQ